MKILITNLHSSHNAGDHVLLEVGLQQLYATFPGCQITLAMNDPASYAGHPDAGQEAVVDSFFAWLKRSPAIGHLRYWRRLTVLWALGLSVVVAGLYRLCGLNAVALLPGSRQATVRAYLEADLVVSCAGNFIYSRGRVAGLPLVGPVFMMTYAWLAGKPIAMLPQTIGPLWRTWERLLVRWLLDRITVVLLRDITSVELLRRMGVPSGRYHLTPDIAFLYTVQDESLGRRLLGRYGVDASTQRPLLGVTLINWGQQHPRFKGQAQYEQAMAAAIQHFVLTYHGQAVLFAQVCGPTPADDDHIPARRVRALLSQCGLADSVTVIDEEAPPGALKSAYGCMDLFLGSRLHSNIFALSEETPVLAIAYQDKTFGVLRMLELGGWAIAIETVDAGQLVTLLDRLWARQGEVRRQLAWHLPALQTEAHQAVALLRATLNGGQ